MTTAIYLASASPRRKELLSQLGIEFTQFSVDADESQNNNESPQVYVERLARLKAQTGVQQGYTDRPVLGSDTVVVIDNQALVKPVDFNDFYTTFKRLSGNTHQVLTAIAFADERQVLSCVVSTDVTFRTVTDEEITAYWQSGEPHDKAGGYGIQGLGGRFITHIAGSYFAVVGLPLYETEALLTRFLKR
ncbi:septum formation inhibitor Maf [Pseudoalteromonas sp. MMG010]|uniref:Maf family protein n=1 Tax=Pseudoalteromonas sp. MMG010 TaxID=2822685 RepID=UPI001B3A24FA|nr:nucleoside triphosphate pyrophosphatase [Pseudoalteromonas sp. MMG010]MBQ4832666.1 septum formation inhibitor Maf [Pseudoalteromonas sp. MMG010]